MSGSDLALNLNAFARAAFRPYELPTITTVRADLGTKCFFVEVKNNGFIELADVGILFPLTNTNQSNPRISASWQITTFSPQPASVLSQSV